MTKYNLILTFFILISFSSFGQKKKGGYYGKKFYVQSEGLFSFPLISKIGEYLGESNYTYVANGNKLEIGSDKFNYGYRLSAGIVLKRNLGFGVEFGHDYSNSNVNYQYNHEMLDISTLVFVPKFEFAHENALLPMGISHHVGIGAEWSTIVDRDYLFGFYDSFTNYNTIKHYSKVTTDKLPFGEIKNIPSIKRYILMYDITMRNPITKNLFLTYGFKYVLKFKAGNQKSSLSNSKNYDYYLDEINYQRNTNIITFHLGLTLAF